MTDGPADRIGRRIKLMTTELKRYVEKRLELMVINIGEHSSRIIAESAHIIAGLVFLLGALVFLLIALALFIGTLLGSNSLGFVIVSIPFLICGLLFVKLKPRSLTKKLRTGFEKELVGMLDNDREHDEKFLPPESQPQIEQIEKKKQYDV